MAKEKQTPDDGNAASSETAPENKQGQHRRTIEERMAWLRAHGVTITNDNDDGEDECGPMMIVGAQSPPPSDKGEGPKAPENQGPPSTGKLSATEIERRKRLDTWCPLMGSSKGGVGIVGAQAPPAQPAAESKEQQPRQRTIEERLAWLKAHGSTCDNDSEDSETLIVAGAQSPPNSGQPPENPAGDPEPIVKQHPDGWIEVIEPDGTISICFPTTKPTELAMNDVADEETTKRVDGA